VIKVAERMGPERGRSVQTVEVSEENPLKITLMRAAPFYDADEQFIILHHCTIAWKQKLLKGPIICCSQP